MIFIINGFSVTMRKMEDIKQLIWNVSNYIYSIGSLAFYTILSLFLQVKLINCQFTKKDYLVIILVVKKSFFLMYKLVLVWKPDRTSVGFLLAIRISWLKLVVKQIQMKYKSLHIICKHSLQILYFTFDTTLAQFFSH